MGAVAPGFPSQDGFIPRGERESEREREKAAVENGSGR